MTDTAAARGAPAHQAPVSPLSGLKLPTVDGMARLDVMGASGRLVLRADRATADRIGDALGLDLALPVNRAGARDGVSTLRLGPDEWLILVDADGDAWLSARIGDAVGDAPVSLVDVSHRSCTLRLEGEAVEDVLAAGCPLPLEERDFPVGRATRTLLAKSEIVLWRRATCSFQIEVATSFAPYVVAFLAQVIADEAAISARDIGGGAG